MSEHMAAISVDVTRFEGVVIPTGFVESYAQLKTFEVRDDDIIICSYRKCGTHWTWEILNMIVAGKAEYAKHWKNSASLILRSPEELRGLESPKILNTHALPHQLPEELWNTKCKIILVERNPKDCAVSFFCQFSKQVWKKVSETKPYITDNWNDFMNLFLSDDMLYGSWFDYTLAWNDALKDHPNKIHKIRYEALQQDCSTVVQSLSEFIQRPITFELSVEIAEACCFQKLKRASEETKDQQYHYRWLKGGTGYFRKGVVGDWKNWFTVVQDERFKRRYEEKFNVQCPF